MLSLKLQMQTEFCVPSKLFACLVLKLLHSRGKWQKKIDCASWSAKIATVSPSPCFLFANVMSFLRQKDFLKILGTRGTDTVEKERGVALTNPMRAVHTHLGIFSKEAKRKVLQAQIFF